jgi:hypothetical protein
MTQPGDLRIPDVVGEITAYRAWFVDNSRILRGPRLVSRVMDTVWPPGEWLCGICPSEGELPGPMPHEGEHGCGVHGARSWRQLHQLGYNDRLGSLDRWFEDGTIVIGTVGLAGRIVPGTQGWRAERGRPTQLWVSYLAWKLAKPLSDTYRVPVGLANTVKGVKNGHRT